MSNFFFVAWAECIKEIIHYGRTLQAVKILVEAQVQQQKTQQCLQKELIAVKKEQLEILKN